MNKQKNKKIINLIIYFIFIIFFVVSLLYILNSRFDLFSFPNKDVENKDMKIEIIDEGTDWYYIAEGTNPGVGNVWSTDKYNASSWEKSEGDFVSKKESAIPSYFFRYEFNIEEDFFEKIEGIEGQIEYEGAVIIYLNGSIIFAGNVPSGGYDSNLDTGSSEIIKGKEVKNFKVTDLSSLKKGENIIGVELHRASKESEDVYFNFEKLNLSLIELKESFYNMDGLLLKQGDIENEIYASWMTNSSDFFRIEYIESEKYKKEKDFSEYGKSILMGRKKIKDEDLYINSAKMSRLKNDTQYLYRIFKIGSNKSSPTYNFKTSKRKGYSFMLLESDFTENENLNEFSSKWDKLLSKVTEKIGDIDFIITSLKNNDESESNLQTKEKFMGYRKPEVLKTKPILDLVTNEAKDEDEDRFYKPQITRKTDNEEGSYYVVYQDTLIFSLTTRNKNYSEQKSFMENAINSKNRKWIIVVMKENKKIKQDMEMFEKLGIDLILQADSAIEKISVGKNRILIEEYGKDSFEKKKEYSIEK